jgi:uncharacterized protein YhbP (UPF0306 family)
MQEADIREIEREMRHCATMAENASVAETIFYGNKAIIAILFGILLEIRGLRRTKGGD